jgi:hypothetical protein
MGVGTGRTDHETPLYPQKLTLNFPAIGGCPVSIVPLCTKPIDFLMNIKMEDKYEYSLLLFSCIAYTVWLIYGIKVCL